MASDLELMRKHALDQACNKCPMVQDSNDSDIVIETAQKFYDFLLNAPKTKARNRK